MKDLFIFAGRKASGELVNGSITDIGNGRVHLLMDVKGQRGTIRTSPVEAWRLSIDKHWLFVNTKNSIYQFTVDAVYQLPAECILQTAGTLSWYADNRRSDVPGYFSGEIKRTGSEFRMLMTNQQTGAMYRTSPVQDLYQEYSNLCTTMIQTGNRRYCFQKSM